MNMKQHIVAALRENFDQWEELLASMSEEQITATDLPANWSIKIVVAHLMVWQQRSIARLEAGLLNREPEYPNWLAGIDPDAEGNADQTNAWIYENYNQQSWPVIYQKWREGFLRFLEMAEDISEMAMLDSSRYAWLNGTPLALTLLASYDHHQEHFEKLQTWLQEQKNTKF